MGVVQGSGIDSDLNEKGQNQALSFFESYKNIVFDRIYISKLKRTFQSVQKFIDLGIPFEKHVGLNEISWGLREGKIPNSEDNLYYRELIGSWRKGETQLRTEEGESPEDVVARQKTVIEIIESRSHEKLILVCMHGRAIRIILAQLLKRPLSDMDFFKHQNLGLYMLGYDQDKKTYKILKNNDVSHLPKEMVSEFIH
jgi:probable phosphoglycerate mutase